MKGAIVEFREGGFAEGMRQTLLVKRALILDVTSRLWREGFVLSTGPKSINVLMMVATNKSLVMGFVLSMEVRKSALALGKDAPTMAAQINPKSGASASPTAHLTKHAAMRDVPKRPETKAFVSHTAPRLLINDAPTKNVQTMPSGVECAGLMEQGNLGPRLLQRNCAEWKVAKVNHAMRGSASSMATNAK
jgi:hypothetical protein